MYNRFYSSQNGNSNDKKTPKIPPSKGPDSKGLSKVPKTPLIWIGLIIVILILSQVFGTSTAPGEMRLTYTQFNNYLEDGKISDGVLEGTTLSVNSKIP
jgi:hypothetical protein